MIARIEYTPNSTSFPCFNANFLSQLTAIFLVVPGFTFSTEDDFGSRTAWRQAIVDGNIIPIYYIQEVDDETEPEDYERSTLGYSYRSADAIYSFTLNYLFDLLYHKKIQEYRGTDYDIIFADVNNNLYATIDGSEIKGFTTSLIDMRSMKIGTTQAAWSPVTIELYDPEEWDLNGLSIKPDWNIAKNDIIFVDFTGVEASVDSIAFRLTDAVYGRPITGLQAHNFIITDDSNGVLTASTIAEVDAGVYVLSGFNNIITTGTISINTRYVGSAGYSAGNVYQFINALDWVLPTAFEAGIPNGGYVTETDWRENTYLASLENSGGRDTTDFVDSNADGLADDYVTAGGTPTCSIVTGNGFTGNAQRMEASASEFTAISNGVDIIINNKAVWLKLTYRANVDAVATLGYLSGSGTNTDTFSLPASSGGAVTVYIEAANSTGWANIDNVGFSLLSNTPNVGDWLEVAAIEIFETTTTGLADLWSLTGTLGISTTPTIVTGNGFTGNAQRVESASTNASASMYIAPDGGVPSEVGTSGYAVLKLKYRTNSNNFFIIGGFSLPANTSDAVEAYFIFSDYYMAIAPGTGLIGIIGGITTGDYFEIDEVRWESIDGIASSWFGSRGADQSPIPYGFSIVTGNGFIGNAQRFDNSGSGVLLGQNFDLAFTDDTATLYATIRTGATTVNALIVYDDNTTNSVVLSSSSKATATEVNALFSGLTGKTAKQLLVVTSETNKFIEIDNIYLIY